MNLPPTLRKLARRGVTFSRALLKDGNLLSRPQPEAVLAPDSYRSSRRRRQRKRLLLKVPIVGCNGSGRCVGCGVCESCASCVGCVGFGGCVGCGVCVLFVVVLVVVLGSVMEFLLVVRLWW